MKAIATFLVIVSLLSVDLDKQERINLTGVVTDGYRNGLAGINVIIKGTTTATITDLCGIFTIPIDSGEITLLFHGMSYDDMRTYEMRLKKSEGLTDTLVFQLGFRKVDNKECDKVNKKLKRRVIK